MSTKKRNDILDSLQPGEFQNITKLASKLNWPRTTLVHYINELLEEGLVIKEHGNIAKRNVTYENKTKFKLEKNKKIKVTLAKEAASKINDQDIVYIDSGSTVLYMIDFLKDRDIIIYTNSISLVEKLPVTGFRPKVYIVPGEVYKQTSSITGVLAIDFLSKVFIDKAFLGVNSVKNNAYITTNLDESVLKKSIAQNALETFILFDKSKVNSNDGKYIFAKSSNHIKEITK